jgi:hypothetical protein
VYLTSLAFWEPFERLVHIPQKTVAYTPLSKVKTLICLFLAQGRHVVEANKRVRPDLAHCESFGCAPCEQSVLQDTLSACGSGTVSQFRSAFAAAFQRFGAAMRHDFSKQLLLLDVDLTGTTCGKKAEGATKGYFAHRKNKTGRQVGRVLASEYDEVVCDAVEAGTEQLAALVPSLVRRAEVVLKLSHKGKERTLIRLDGGGGTKEDINWLCEEGYRFLAKLYSWRNFKPCAESVEQWTDDPRTPGRQVGRVTKAPSGYAAGVTFIAMRFLKADGTEGGAVLATNLSEDETLALLPNPSGEAGEGSEGVDEDTDKGALAYVALYDQRGGGIETSFKEDKQGLALDACNKKSLEAQRMIVTTLSLAHNIIVWSRGWFALHVREVKALGIQRTVRDLLALQGTVTFLEDGRHDFVFQERDPFARFICRAFTGLFAPHLAALRLGQI